MKINKLKIYGTIALVLVIISSCGKELAPSGTATRKDINYDDAAFNYVYVEAIKQKLMGNSSDALKYFEQCIQIKPQSDASYFQMAQILISSGDINNGKKMCAKALSIDPENIWYLMMMAGVYYQDHKLDSAIIYYENAVKYFPDKEDLKLTLGNLYSENRNFSKANTIYNSLDKEFGVNESSTVAEVRNFMAEGKYDEAMAKAQLLVKQYPANILYNGLVAEIYRGKGEIENARSVYEQMIENNPDDPQTQLSICDFMISEGDYSQLFEFMNTVMLNNKVSREDKISLLAKLIEIPEVVKDYGDNLMLTIMILEANFKNDDIIPLLRPELLVKQNKLNQASERLEEIIKGRPDDYFAWEKLLLVYLQKEDWQKLLTKGRECATMFNRSFLAKILYANAAIETGNYPVAIDELKKAEILAGSDKDMLNQVLTMRADAFYRMKDYSKAFEVFEQALKSNSEDLTVMNNYAYYLAEQNTKLKEAEEMAKKVIETEKNNNTFLDTYGWVLYKRGKYREAAKVMDEIINSADKPDAEYYEHYGYILKKLGQCKEAVKYWKLALDLDSTKSTLEKEIKDCER